MTFQRPEIPLINLSSQLFGSETTNMVSSILCYLLFLLLNLDLSFR
ncbi:MAG: hypothetical protein H0V88_10520 [Pyrinomonadaceae bacterium]|nr:hypothetical protein [Pyrinomonadaceae bacterium]